MRSWPLATTLLLAGCPEGGPPATCVADLDPDCAPLIDPPTFDAVFAETLKPTCATGAGTCHTSDGAQGGLVFEDPDASHALLLGEIDGNARVIPGDPACSTLVRRLHAADPAVRMPPGPTPLSDAEACLIERWIADGAAR